MKKDYKIVILGAGIAGLSLALFLKKNDIHDFVVLNVTSNNTHKACTGLLTQKTINLLEEIEISLDGYHKVKEFYGVFNGTNKIDYSDSNLSIFYHENTGRESLDNALFSKCLSKDIEIIENCKDIEIRKHHKEVHFKDEIIHYDFLVDARGFYPDIVYTKHKEIGFEAKIKHKHKNVETCVDVLLEDNIRGYGWIIYGPKYDVVGVVDEYKSGTNYREYFKRFLKEHYDENVSDYEAKGAYLPLYPRKLLVNKNYIQIGDKAGLVDPLTQEGIYFALLSAKKASEAISVSKLKNYKKEMNGVVSNFRFAYYLRKIFFTKSFQNKIWDMGSSHKFTKYVYMRYSNDATFFNYKKIARYHKEYKMYKIRKKINGH